MMSERSQIEKKCTYLNSIYKRVFKRQNNRIRKICLQYGFQISRAGGLIVKYHKGTFWSDVNILYHYFGYSYISVRICQVSSNCTIKFVNYVYANYTSGKLPIVYLIKRYFEKPKFQPSELTIGQKKYHTSKLPGNQVVLDPGSLLVHTLLYNFQFCLVI